MLEKESRWPQDKRLPGTSMQPGVGAPTAVDPGSEVPDRIPMNVCATTIASSVRETLARRTAQRNLMVGMMVLCVLLVRPVVFNLLFGSSMSCGGKGQSLVPP